MFGEKTPITYSVTGGAYKSKMVEDEILYTLNGVTLKKVGNGYPLFMDGLWVDTYHDIKTAETMFTDFSGLTDNKFKKWKAALNKA